MLDHHSLLQEEGFPWRWIAVRAHLHENGSADVQTSPLRAPGDERTASLKGCKTHSPGQLPKTGSSLAFERHTEMLPGFHTVDKGMSKPALIQIMGLDMSLQSCVPTQD